GGVAARPAEKCGGMGEQGAGRLGGAGQAAWLDRLEAEAGTLAAAVSWSLACDPTPLPHLFRILWPFWYLRDRQAEARPWVGQLLPAGSFDPQARAELEWTAMVTANEGGDDAATPGARRRPGPLLGDGPDPHPPPNPPRALAPTAP